jgi:hypothetical protein
MCHDELGAPCTIVLNPDLALLATRADEDELALLLRDSTEATWVWGSLNLVHKLEIDEVVNKDFVIKCHNDTVSAQAHRPHFCAEGQLTNAPALVVVPYHYLKS